MPNNWFQLDLNTYMENIRYIFCSDEIISHILAILEFYGIYFKALSS